MRRGFDGVVALIVAAGLTGCGLPPMLSDTGYRGTWHRSGPRFESILAIAQSDDRWFFRWTLREQEAGRTILCDWEGRCLERIKGKTVATYAIQTRFDPAKGLLFTDTVEERAEPLPKTFRYTDVLEVVDQGRTLRNYTIDRDGNHFEGGARPMRVFTKVADSIADPPRAVRR